MALCSTLSPWGGSPLGQCFDLHQLENFMAQDPGELSASCPKHKNA